MRLILSRTENLTKTDLKISSSFSPVSRLIVMAQRRMPAILESLSTAFGLKKGSLALNHFDFRATSPEAFNAAKNKLARNGYDQGISLDPKRAFFRRQGETNWIVVITKPTPGKRYHMQGLVLDHIGFILSDDADFSRLYSEATDRESKTFGGRTLGKSVYEIAKIRLVSRLGLSKVEFMNGGPPTERMFASK